MIPHTSVRQAVLVVLTALALGIAPGAAGQTDEASHGRQALSSAAGQGTLDHAALAPSLPLSQAVYEHWAIEDGLPSVSVSSIAQTPDGYLWIGTEEGLVRFDGLRFTTFDADTEPALGVSTITSLAVDADGVLWIGTRGGGVSRLAGGHFAPASADENAQQLAVMALGTDPSGGVWAGTMGEGLVHFGRVGERYVEAPAEIAGRFVSVVRTSDDGTTWVGTERGLFTVDGDGLQPTAHAPLSGVMITAINLDSPGRVIVATLDRATRNPGLFELSGSAILDISEQLDGAPGRVKELRTDRAGSLWIARVGGGLQRLTSGGRETIDRAWGLVDNDLTALYEDAEGAMWFGTQGGGLGRFRPGKFVALSSVDGLPHDQVYTVTEGPDGTIWAGTENGLVAIENGIVRPERTAGLELPDSHILTLGASGDGTIWIGTSSAGLVEWSPDKPPRVHSSQTGLPGDAIFAQYEDSRGRLWVGTDAGVAVVEAGEIRTLTMVDGLSSDFPTAFAEGPDGSIWIATYDAGINQWKDGQVISRVSAGDGMSDASVLSLHVDVHGRVWAGTWNGGLNVITGEGVTVIRKKDGLFDKTVLSITPDGHGRVWMTSNRGVYHVQFAAVLDRVAGNSSRIESTVYDVRDGLKTPEANGGQQPAAWLASDGGLWIPTALGLARIDAANLPRDAAAPHAIIEGLTVDGQTVDITKPIELQPGSDRLVFSFTATALSDATRLTFRHQLQGHDGRWEDGLPERRVQYTSLDPGDYELVVEARNGDGVPSAVAARIEFTLQPWFYQTLWFRLLLLAGLVLLIATAFRSRLEVLKKRAAELERKVEERTVSLREAVEETRQANAVITKQADKLRELDHFKTRFFANVSHEFRTPLTMIIGPLENALAGRYGKLTDSVGKQLKIMLRNSLRLMRLINQLLELSKIEAGRLKLRAKALDLVGFSRDLVETMAPFSEKKNITLDFRAEQESVELYFEPDKLEKVLLNLLSNAFKFTPQGGEIEVSISRVSDAESDHAEEARLIVRDTGRGIPEEDLAHVFDRFHQSDGSLSRDQEGSGIGLSLVKELVDLHGGRIGVQSKIDVGTEFILHLPLGTDHLPEGALADATEDALLPNHGMTRQAAVAEFSLDRSAGNEGSTDTPAPADGSDTDDPDSSGEPVYDIPDDAATVLVVDDNVDVREYVGSILGTKYHIGYAKDGVDALENIAQAIPDIVVSDIMMPRMDGTELCRRIKDDAVTNHIPVILISARATHEMKIEGLERGADDYVPKPFNAEELLARVQNLLTMRRHEVELKDLNERLEDRVEEQLETILVERTRYEAELVEERDRAEASSRMKSVILDNINHEFRTPITVILSATQILSDEVEGELKSFLDDIETGTVRLHQTLDAVARLSSLESEGDAVETESIDIGNQVRRVCDAVADRAGKKGLQVGAHVPSSGDLKVETARDHLRPIIDALVDNALRFTDEGSVTVRLVPAADSIRVVVEDTGRGIAEDFLPMVFEAFTQGSSGLDRSHEGLGLGLAIAKRHAEIIGAELHASSTPGEGSSFTLTLPRKAVSVRPKPKATPESEAG